MRRSLLFLSLLGMSVLFIAPESHAVALKAAPLEYRTSLKKGEKQKGFIDVSNPSKDTVRVTTSAQAFRQVDNDGSLQFYDNEQVKAGVRLDLDEFDLGPHEAVRMYFLLDSTKLPSGDVYAAIFFTTASAAQPNQVGQAVRLGTLLSIVNGTPGPRAASIMDLSVPWLQLSDTIRGSYDIKNTARPGSSTGFYPTVSLYASPFGQTKEQKGKLTFAGITRSNDFSLSVFPLGLYYVSATYGASSKAQWVVVASPLALLILAVLAAVVTVTWRYSRYQKKRRRLRL